MKLQKELDYVREKVSHYVIAQHTLQPCIGCYGEASGARRHFSASPTLSLHSGLHTHTLTQTHTYTHAKTKH